MANVIFDSNSRVYLSNDGEGTNNTVFGYGAGGSIDAGDNYNVFIGHNVGSTDMATAVSNTGVGYAALVSLTQGDNNTILGAESGYALTTGDNNTFIGMQSGDALTQGDNNIAIGNAAMGALSTTDGSDKNIAIGNYAMDGVTTLAATENVFIGFDSGGGSWTGTLSQKNIAVGNSTLTGAMDNANHNIAVGHQALNGLTTGDGNVSIGGGSGYYVTDVDNLVLIGKDAGGAINNAAADGTVAIGGAALSALTSGAGNTAIGYASLDATGTGIRNTCIGYQTGTSLVDGSDQNVAIGFDALSGGNNDTTHDNIAIGYSAGDVITGGSQNICIGSLSDPSAAGGTNQIVIGYNATGDADNSVVIGNSDIDHIYMAQDSGATIYCTGVNFPDDASSGVADVNTLDAYEEGTFTATLRGSTGEPGSLITSTVGNYTKIGRNVTIGIAFENRDTTGYSGYITVTGLPFNVLSHRAVFAVALYNMATFSSDAVVGIVTSSGSTIEIMCMRSADSWATVTHNASASSYGWIMGTYIT